MPRTPHYPRQDDFWGKCGTCGNNIPSRYLKLTRKHGYQCLPGNPITRGCFDGDYDRDDIQYAFAAGEGARTVSAPLTMTNTEGTSGDPPLGALFLRDQVTGTIYLVDFGQDPPTLTAVSASAVVGLVWNAVALSNAQEFQLYIANGVFHVIRAEMTLCVITNLTSGLVLNPSGSVTTPGGNPIVPPGPPVVFCPTTVVTNIHVVFTAVVSLFDGVTITNYHWDFGDGTTADTATPTTSHDYASEATYTVIVTVTDNFGRTASSPGGCSVTTIGGGPPCAYTTRVYYESWDWLYIDANTPAYVEKWES